ncbi:MAG: hypothetical protein HRT35_25500 [Algicola sp.]|nr:hypothetical protein [Algicola sp.]
MTVTPKNKQAIETEEPPLSKNISLAISIAQSSGTVVPEEAIELVCRIESGELSTHQAIELVIKAHQ